MTLVSGLTICRKPARTFQLTGLFIEHQAHHKGLLLSRSYCESSSRCSLCFCFLQYYFGGSIPNVTPMDCCALTNKYHCVYCVSGGGETREEDLIWLVIVSLPLVHVPLWTLPATSCVTSGWRCCSLAHNSLRLQGSMIWSLSVKELVKTQFYLNLGGKENVLRS